MDRKLFTLVAAGDQEAFRRIVVGYTPALYRHLLIYVKDAQRAEELTQDIFMDIWRNRQKLAEIENVSGYIYVMTRNRALMALREKLHVHETPPDDMLQSLLCNPDSAVELKELRSVLQDAIDLLPPRRKQVFVLSRHGNLTYEEIANQLKISKSAVKQHIIEALVFLRTYLKEKMGMIVTILLWWPAAQV